MKKWKIIKGTEADFKNAPESVTVLIAGDCFCGYKYWADKFEDGSNFVSNSYPERYPEGVLKGIFTNGCVIAERVPVEDVMAIPRGWLVNGKFTEDDRYAKWASEHAYEVIAIDEPTVVPSIVDVILETSLSVPRRPVRQVYKKLVEEVGEVGDALLAVADGADPDELLEGEVADVIICAVDLLFVHIQDLANGDLTDQQVAHEVKNLLEDRVKAKTEKWSGIVSGG